MKKIHTSGKKVKPAPKTKPRNADNRKANKARTAGGKVPQGRTLTTRDKYLDKKARQPDKKRPVVVIETNGYNDLAVVQLSSRAGKDRSRLKKYQQGQSYFKHYIEIVDDEGKPIRVNDKFKENHPNMDVSSEDIVIIRDTLFKHSKPMQENKRRMKKFKGKKD